jgi:hypothetical protein
MIYREESAGSDHVDDGKVESQITYREVYVHGAHHKAARCPMQSDTHAVSISFIPARLGLAI